MSAKHTPGPWFEHREGFSTVYVEARIGGGMAQEVAACGPTAEGQEQQCANAQLIAAAPDLLEALQLLLRWIDEPSDSALEMVREQRHIAQARAIIAKATGAKP